MAQTIPAPQTYDAERVRTQLGPTLHDHWRLFMFEGVALVALGAAAIAVPPLASFAVTVFLGWLFLVGGTVGLVATFSMRPMRGFWWSLLSSALALTTGAILLWWPLRGVMSLTLVLAIYFMADGISSIMLALDHRHEASPSWGWLVASGVVDWILAAFILAGWPQTGAWVIGLFVGIDLVFAGAALVMVAWQARKAATHS